MSLCSCIALKRIKLWTELVHIWGEDIAISEELVSSPFNKLKNISERFISLLRELLNASVWDLVIVLQWVVLLSFFFALGIFLKLQLAVTKLRMPAAGISHASTFSSITGIVSKLFTFSVACRMLHMKRVFINLKS